MSNQILYKGIYIQHIYHHGEMEASSLSSLANTRGLKGPRYYKGQNSLGGIGLRDNSAEEGLAQWTFLHKEAASLHRNFWPWPFAILTLLFRGLES